jgi:hypothetical protein
MEIEGHEAGPSISSYLLVHQSVGKGITPQMGSELLSKVEACMHVHMYMCGVCVCVHVLYTQYFVQTDDCSIATLCPGCRCDSLESTLDNSLLFWGGRRDREQFGKN